MAKKPMTHIQVSIETWQMLKARKYRPNQTFDEIIREALLEMPEVKENG